MANDPNATKLSRKEFARQMRRAAYLRAKEQRANDPRQIAMKEAAKQRRREAYQTAKERRKAATAQQKKNQRDLLAAKRAAKDEVLMKMVGQATDDSRRQPRGSGRFVARRSSDSNDST